MLIRNQTEDETLQVRSAVFGMSKSDLDRIRTVWSIAFIFSVYAEVCGIDMYQLIS
jgi:hypothetical protein